MLVRDVSGGGFTSPCTHKVTAAQEGVRLAPTF